VNFVFAFAVVFLQAFLRRPLLRTIMIETHTKLFIDGTWAKPATAATIDVISPHTSR
jgi:hypothetical protein